MSAAPVSVAGIDTLPALFDALRQEAGDGTAFIQGQERLTYAGLWDRSARLAAYLQSACGIGRGDRVAVMLPNLVAFPVACLAILRIGAVQVNVNPFYVARELDHQLADSGARAIIVIDTAVATLRAIDPPALETVVVVGEDGDAGTALARDGRWQVTRWADAVAGDAHPAPCTTTRNDLAFLQYTGGTTGPAKGAMLTHGNVLANIDQFLAWTADHLRPGAVVTLTAIPLYHIFALTVNLFAVAALRGTNVIVRNPGDVATLCDEWERAGVTFFTGVNTLFQALGRSERFARIAFAPDLRTLGGGAAIHRGVSRRWRELTGGHVIEGYGLSETSPILCCTPFDDTEFHGSIGFPFPGTDIAIRDDDGVNVAPGEIGELVARGPQVMAGYWNQPDATAAATTPDGYFRTGDLARQDADGRFFIVDRRKDMILVSGFNVYPNEIEEVAALLDGVAECACVGVPDPATGEAVALYVVAADARLDRETVIAHCRANLTPYKVPRHILFIDTMPKSTVGKILRRELRDGVQTEPHPRLKDRA